MNEIYTEIITIIIIIIIIATTKAATQHVSGQVVSHTNGLPALHGSKVMPSVFLPSSGEARRFQSVGNFSC